MIHTSPSSLIHCMTTDGKVCAIPSRVIQYFRPEEFQLALDGHWICGMDSDTLKKAVRKTFVIGEME